MQHLLSLLDGGQEQFIWVQTKDLGLTMPTSLFDLFLEERTEMKERASNYGFNTWMKEYQKKEKKEKEKKNKVKQSDHDRKHSKTVSSSTALLVGGSSGSGSSSGGSSSSGTSASTLATLSSEQSATVTAMKHSDGKFSSLSASSSLKAVGAASPVASSSSSSSSSNPQSDQERELFVHTYRTMLEALQFKSQMVEYLSLAAKPLKGSDTPIFNIMVPGYSSLPAVNYGNHASLIVKSLYPHCQGRPYREGDPICDAVAVSLYENRVVCCSTDGCNWGEHPRKASRRANKNFMRYVQTNQSSIKSILDAVYFLTAALADSHLAIIHNSDDLRSGSTTIMGGILLEIDKTGAVSSSGSGSGSSGSSGGGSSGGSGGNNPGTELYDKPNWVFVSVSLGDCKAFRVSKNGLVFDLSEESRNDPFDVTDPGGRLGVHAGEPKPDLRSLFAFWSPVDEGDVISLMSDGISDNLDPQIHGLMPADLGVECDSWSNLSRGLGSILKSEYVKNYITEKIVPTEPSFITPNSIAHGLMNNALSVTEHHRNYLSQNPSLKAPSDYSQFPGKLDHASVVSFRVGHVSKAPIASLPSVSREAVVPRPFLDDSSSTLSSVPNDLIEKKRRISFSVSSNVVLANSGGSSPPSSSPFNASPAVGKFMGRSASEQGTFPGRMQVRPASTAPPSSQSPSTSGSGSPSASQEAQSSPSGWVSISGTTRGRRSSIRLTDKKAPTKRDSAEEKIEQPSDKSSEPPAEN